MVPFMPPSGRWLEGAKASLGIKENHPKVVRILEILRKKEAGAVTIEEHKEFLVLDDQLISAHEFIHGKIIYPSGEVAYYPEMPTREEIVNAIDLLFQRDAKKSYCPTPIPPQSKHWLDLMGSVFHVDQSHPRVARVFELMQKAESGATITDDEAKQFQWEIDLLDDEIIPIWDAAHQGKVTSTKVQAYMNFLTSPPLPRPSMNHESMDGVECRRCGLQKEFWERHPDCGRFQSKFPGQK